MLRMTQFDYEFKLGGRSIPEIRERFDDALTLHQRAGFKLNGRKLSADGLSNAVALHFLDMDAGAQARVLADCLPRIEAMMAGGGEKEGQGGAPRETAAETPAEPGAGGGVKYQAGRATKMTPAEEAEWRRQISGKEGAGREPPAKPKKRRGRNGD